MGYQKTPGASTSGGGSKGYSSKMGYQKTPGAGTSGGSSKGYRKGGGYGGYGSSKGFGVSGSSGGSGGEDSNKKITPISEVEPMLDNIAVQRRCISIWHSHRLNAAHDPYSLDLVLQDAQNNRIQCYTVSNFGIAENGGRLPLLPHRCDWGELFYLRILLNKVRGPMGCDDLKEYDDVVYPTYREACYAHGLLEDDTEYIDGLLEARLWGMGDYLRSFFVMLLMTDSMSRPDVVWQKTWHVMAEDVLNVERKKNSNACMFPFIAF
ncbi:hypothetical protein Tco_0368613 [Tanacetum coccineum]